MSIAAAALGLSREFEFDGQTYRLRPLTYEDLARFSLWVEGRARAGMFRAGEADGVDPKQLLAAYLDAVAAGDYEPGGGTFGRATQSEAGGRKLIELMLDAPAADRGPLAWQIYADPPVFRRVLTMCAEINQNPAAARLMRTPSVRAEAPSP